MAEEKVSDGAKKTNKSAAGQEDLVVRALPHDVLAVVFRRLAPRWLAASRCVCRDWRAAIDDRSLLRADLLPLSFHGIFVHFYLHRLPEFFPNAAVAPAITGGRVDFLPNAATSFADLDIEDHCNGLLLLDGYVVNPATRRWDPLPPCPPDPADPPDLHLNMDEVVVVTRFNKYLVFDPAVSPHYQVFVVPNMCTVFYHVEEEYSDTVDPMVEESSLSSSPACAMRVFSSNSGSWEWRPFLRDELSVPPGPVRKINTFIRRRCAAYWRGSLYVQRNTNAVLKISPSSNTYRVISPPAGMRQSSHPSRYLDTSAKGVYFAALDNYRLQVWILNEQTEWMLRLDKDIKPVLRHQQVTDDRSWMLKYVGGDDARDDNRDTSWYVPQESFSYYPKVRILGFHPYQEVIFLSEAAVGESVEKGLTYHLSTSKVQDLGDIGPTNYLRHYKYRQQSIKYSCSYTPCWLGEFPRNS